MTTTPIDLTALTAESLAEVPDHVLWDVIGRLQAIIEARANTGIVAHLREVVARESMPEVATVSFGTSEWDNGYFYSPTDVALRDASGTPVHTDFEFAEDDERALDAMLTDLASTGSPLTGWSVLTVNLSEGTVTRKD